MKRLAPPGSEGRITRLVPLQHIDQTEDISATTCYRASPLVDYVTGSLIMVDGGMNPAGSGIWNQALTAMLGE